MPRRKYLILIGEAEGEPNTGLRIAARKTRYGEERLAVSH
jgi:hypothetical protein